MYNDCFVYVKNIYLDSRKAKKWIRMSAVNKKDIHTRDSTIYLLDDKIKEVIYNR